METPTSRKRRWPRPSAPALAAALAAAALCLGCGSKFGLPPETPGGLVTGKDEYIFTGGLAGVAGTLTDVLITRSSGTELLVAYGAEPDTYASCSAPGRVLPGGTLALYPIFPPPGSPPLSISFNGMWRPQHMSEAGGRLFVLDAGDTCQRFLSPNLAPRVVVYQIGNATPITAFSDTNWAEIRGIAASSDHTVYLSGTFRVTEPDEFGRRTARFRDGIWRYKESSGYLRDTGWVVLEGSGLGFVTRNSGLAWGPSSNPYLWVADGEKQAVQKLAIETDSLSHGVYQFDGTQTGLRFQDPVDVTVDDDGYLYVVDRGSARVLRYLDEGGSADFVQLVNTGKPDGAPRLQKPAAVASLDTMVYVADPPARATRRFERHR